MRSISRALVGGGAFDGLRHQWYGATVASTGSATGRGTVPEPVEGTTKGTLSKGHHGGGFDRLSHRRGGSATRKGYGA